MVSVEHDPAWGSEVSALAPDNLSVLVKEEGAPCDDTPDQVLSSYFRIPEPLIELPRPKAVEHGLASKEFAAYATEICRFGEGHFDIVVKHYQVSDSRTGLVVAAISWIAFHCDGSVAM